METSEQHKIESDRRPIQTRGTWWAKVLATNCARMGLTPNQVSVASVLFAAVGSVMLCFTSTANQPVSILLFVGAACCIQLRLLCNMIDGMIAVEGNMQSKVGAVFNEFPDRLADTFFLVSGGYAAMAGSEQGIVLGLTAALLAIGTAYIRAFGASQGLPQDFGGPMAKQHRMFVLTVAALAAAVESAFKWPAHAMFVGLLLISFGGLVTCFRRTTRLLRGLENRP